MRCQPALMSGAVILISLEARVTLHSTLLISPPQEEPGPASGWDPQHTEMLHEYLRNQSTLHWSPSLFSIEHTAQTSGPLWLQPGLQLTRNSCPSYGGTASPDLEAVCPRCRGGSLQRSIL